MTQRWIGRTILDVYSTEFGAYSREYYKEAIQSGRIRVNGNKLSEDYILKNGDKITHTVHRRRPDILVLS